MYLCVGEKGRLVCVPKEIISISLLLDGETFKIKRKKYLSL